MEMSVLLSFGSVVAGVSIGLACLSSGLGAKMIYDFQKQTPFECGFDPVGSGRLPFSVRFFLVAIVFLVFDVEIALLLPMLVDISSSEGTMWVMLSLGFINILTLGTVFEWEAGVLDWKQ